MRHNIVEDGEAALQNRKTAAKVRQAEAAQGRDVGLACSHEQVVTMDCLWRKGVATHPDAWFLVFEAQDGEVTSWTYLEFDKVVARTACRLKREGVHVGASVHIVLRNSPGFVAIWLAAARLGAWIVPVDPMSSSRDISSQLRRTGSMFGVYGVERAQAYHEAAKAAEVTSIQMREDATDLGPGGALWCSGEVNSVEETPAALHRLAVMFTSGTTSEPKGVVLTQQNYAHVGNCMALAADLRAEHRWLVSLPLFHANAQYYCIAPAISTGASVALTSQFSASRWTAQAKRLRATHASLFAAPMRMILAHRTPTTPRLRLSHVWFAQSLGLRHYEEFAELVGCRPRQLYGMTETVSIVTADMGRIARHDIIGSVVGGRRIMMLDVDTGRTALPGKPGMLLVSGIKGEDLFEGYLGDPATTQESFEFRNGYNWFRTGDLVLDTGGGILRFVGRIDDVVKVSGENVSLTEVEAALAEAPGVLEAAVVARLDPIRDHVPVAYVVPRSKGETLSTEGLALWAAQHLSPACRPREWYIVPSLPRTSVGKIRRFQLDGRESPLGRGMTGEGDDVT